MRKFHSLRIRIYTLVAVGMGSLVLLASAVYLVSLQSERMEREVQGVSQTVQQSYQLQSVIYRLQLAENEIRNSLELTRKEEALDVLSAAAKAIADQEAQINKLELIDSSEPAAQLEALRDRLGAYRDLFEALTSTIEQVSAVTTDMVFSATSFENVVRNKEELVLLSGMLQLRQIENEFLWKRDPNKESEFKRIVGTMEQGLSQSTNLLGAERSILIRNITAYGTSFQELLLLMNKQQALAAEAVQIQEVLQKHSSELISALSQQSDTLAMEKRELAVKLNLGLLLLTFATLAALCLIGLPIARAIVQGVHKLQKGADLIGGGDLSRRVSVSDKGELGLLARAFNDMAAKVGDSFQKVTEVSMQLAASTQTLSAAFEQTAAHTEYTNEAISSADGQTREQREQLKLGVLYLPEVNAQLQGVHQAANNIQDLLTRTGESGEKGLHQASVLEAVHRSHVVVSAHLIQDIQATVSSAEEIMRLVQVIQEISDLIGLISLNASIEAARVGEQGRGFAVVAREIGQLADKTKNQLQEINRTTKGMHTSIGQLTDRVAQLKHSGVEQGKAVDGAQSAFREIAALVDSVTSGVYGIRDAIVIVTNTSDHLSQSMKQIQSSSEESSQVFRQLMAASAEQKSAITGMNREAGALSELAIRLTGETDQFKLSPPSEG